MSEPKIITRAERLARNGQGCSSCGKSVAVPTIPPQLPSNWQMLKNLVGAAADAVKNGFDVRGPEETEAALKICAECPYLLHDDRGLRCANCGCFLKYKLELKAWKCPLGKW